MVKSWIAAGLGLPRSEVAFLTEPCSFPTFLLCWSSSMWPHCFRCAPATIEWLVFWLWLTFGWLPLDLQRFCLLSGLWILLIFRWNISQFRGMGLKSGHVHMPSPTVTSWRWHLNHGVDWRPLFARMPLAWPSILKSWQMVEVWCQHLNAETQTLMAKVCVVGLLCGGYYVWAHVTRFLQCLDLLVTSAFVPDLSHKCVLACQRALVIVHHL